MKIFDHFRTPLSLRIENAVRSKADQLAEREYHRYLGVYFQEQRLLINPGVSAADACEYARLFTEQEEHEEKRNRADRRYRDAEAKVKALTAKKSA